jgi:hypothetical protein
MFWQFRHTIDARFQARFQLPRTQHSHFERARYLTTSQSTSASLAGRARMRLPTAYDATTQSVWRTAAIGGHYGF